MSAVRVAMLSLRDMLFAGVKAFFVLTLFGLEARGDQLVLFNIPSPRGINWHSPHTLLKSVIKNHNSGASHEIGHVFVGVYCSDTGMTGEPDVLTGMTSASDNSEELLRERGYGLGILFHNFEGRLNSAEEARQDIWLGLRTGRLSYLAFDISRSTCQRLVEYEMEYRQRGYDRNYGLPNRPLYGEGAGCSAYGVSFLDIAGVESGIFSGQWTRSLRAPYDLVGGPMTGNFVPVGDIFVNPLLRWATAEEPHFPINFWEPDLMHAYVLRVARGDYALPFKGVIEIWGRAYGVRMDVTHIPTPSAPFFRN